jgi:hypothetical protein
MEDRYALFSVEPNLGSFLCIIRSSCLLRGCTP